MNLKEVLAANPEAKTEYDAAIVAAENTGRAEGETAGTEKMGQAFKAALPILSSDTYPDTVKERVTAKAMAGDVEGLADFVALHDMNVETAAAAAAAGENGKESVPAGQMTDSEKSDADLKAHQDRIKNHM